MMRTIYSEKQLIASNENLEEKNYWLNILSGEWIKSSFPYDCEKTSEYQTCQLETITFKFTESLNSMINKITVGSDYTLHVLLVAGLVELLRRYSDKKDIIVATPIYKQEVDREYINTILAIRNQLTDHMTFKDLLLQVRETIRGAVENQNYPIGILAEKLNLQVFEDDFPLFDIAVLLENVHNEKYLQQISIPFNLVFSYYRGENQLVTGKVEYNSLLYKKSTIEGIITHLTQLLTNALSDVNLSLVRIEILAEEERRQLLFEFNSTGMEYPRDKTIHELFEEQVRKTPNDTAVIDTESTRNIAYKELNENANRLAQLLRKKGVAADRIVGIMMDNTIEMVTGILGILKAGGAYLPIGTGFPQKRILSMLNDSGANIFFTKDKLAAKFKLIPFRNFEEGTLKKVITPTCPQVMDLDTLQVPDRSLVDYEKYHPFIGQSMVKNSITLQFSRGCMFKCLYCFKIWPDKYALRSGENLFEEVNMYYKLGVRRFGFTDDLPNFNKKEIGKFYQLVIKNGLKIHMHFPNGIRGDILNPDFIDLMMEAGVVTMDLALETASPRLQKLIRKNINIDRLRRNVEYIIEKYPHAILGVQIMHGFPTETEEEAKASLEFIKSFRWLPFGYMHILKIYPNTGMGRFAMEHGVSKEDIIKSMALAYHELPYTLPFPQSFTRQCQSEYLGEFFLVKERLLKVLPNQMSMLTEDELVQKYNSYLPTDIKIFSGLLKYIGISREEINGEFLPGDYGKVENFNENVRRYFPVHKSNSNATRLLLLDLSQHFTHESYEMYHVVDPPLGLMYLLTHLNKNFGPTLNGKIAKSQVDFDNYDELKKLVEDFNPHIIGVRTLTYYKDFFHKAISLIRQWGFAGPIIAGGPYATSSYDTMLQDVNIDLAVLGEGEITMAELMTSIMNNEGKLPGEAVLKDIQGIAFVEKKEKARLAWMNREILLMEHIDNILCRESAQNPAPINQSTDMAYVIYTSGSTGIAKGVMVQHRNVVNQLIGLKRKFGLDTSLNYLLLAAFTFDVSVMHMFSALSTGAKLFLITEEIKKDPLKLWQFIYENKINILNIVPAFMKAILENLESKKIHFKYLFVGGDVFDLQLYEKLGETFAAETIINIYGPTETTINASLYLCNRIDRHQRIPIGKPVMNYKAYILGSDLNLVSIGGIGELCISGEGVARGYLNRPELTAEKFKRAVISQSSLVISSSKRLYKSTNDRSYSPHSPFTTRHSPLTNNHSPLYRTGDVARWLPDGNIDFLGRKDNQVKIRGFRIEPGEIEKRFLEMEDIKEAVVVVKEDESGDKYLCAYVTSDKKVVTTQLRECLKEELPDYMIPTYIVHIEKMPFTTSHKIDTRILKEKQKDVIGNYVAPANEIEKELAGIWAEVLNINKEQMGVNSNFFDLGGHSLKATILISKIHKKLNVKIPFTVLFKTPTIKALGEYIQEAVQEKVVSIKPVEKKEYFPLSSAQKRIYILQQMEPGNISYNMPYIIPLLDVMEKEKLEAVFKKLIRRHESLRTCFITVHEEPVQKINKEVNFSLHCSNASGAEADNMISNFVEPFDLSNAPLLRVDLLTIDSSRQILLIDMHHIITDGISQNILEKEFMALYSGEEFPPLRLQYKDYAEWQNSQQQRLLIRGQERYWMEMFADEVPVLNLPTDYPRPLMQSFEGNGVRFLLTLNESRVVKELVYQTGATLYMCILSVFTILLSRLSSQEDIIVGTPIAARRHADLEKAIGMFVNTLAMRNTPCGEMSCREFLQGLKEHTLKAYENQEYPFEELVDKISVNRDTGRNPIFDVMFSLLNIEEYNYEIPESEEKEQYRYNHRKGTSKFDLALTAVDLGERFLFTIEYCTRLFKPETIDRFISYFKRVLNSLLGDWDKKLSELDIITKEEKHRFLYEFNDTEVEYPKNKTIHQLFEEQTKQTPDHITLVGREGDAKKRRREEEKIHLSYRELDERSGKLAGLLLKKGVQPDAIVAIMMERSIDLVIGILGILKAGVAYMPIDPDYPRKRIEYMLKDSGAKLLVTTNNKEGKKVGRWQGENDLGIIFIDSLSSSSILTSYLPIFQTSHPLNLAYIIYTSGSAGSPKGVMVEHRNVVRLVKNAGYIHYSTQDRLLPTGAEAFDISTFEIWSPLLNSVMLLLVSKEVIINAKMLKNFLVKYDVSILHLIPQLFNQMAAQEIELFSGLSYFLVGGDLVKSEAVNRLRNAYPHLKIVQCYGPTENTTFSTTFQVDKDYNMRIPIGKPIGNSSAFIVDKYDHLQPVGVPGELLVGGDGVAMGYLNKPELSAEKFQRTIDSHLSSPNDQWTMTNNRLYRTGDLACWLPDGNIEFLGRKDFQVKIRGFRIELGEIESRLSNYPGIKEAVVVVREDEPGDKYLCAYIVSDSGYGISKLREYLSKELSEYMLPSYFVQMDKIPLTPNGKIDRKSLPEPKLEANEEYVAPRDAIEERLSELWMDILATSRESASQRSSRFKERIGIDDNFFHLGGHSLKATILVSKIHKVFDVKVPLVEVFKLQSIRELSRYIKGSLKEKHKGINPIEKKEYYALSPAQKRLYILQQLVTDSTAYNMPYVIPFLDGIEKEKLELVFRGLIARHESLRTSFITVHEEPVQKINKEIDYSIRCSHASRGESEHIISNFSEPFDLSKAPLLRVELLTIESTRQILLIDMHHIITDGTSQNLLEKEFTALYSGEELPPLRLQYKDYAEWQNNEQQKSLIKEQERYWLEMFSGEIPVLNLPTDYPRPIIQGFAGNWVNFLFTVEESLGLKELVKHTGATLYMCILSVFTIMLSRLSGQEDIIVGTPIAARRHADLEKIIGMLVNTLAMRNAPCGEKSYREFLLEIKEHTLKAYENQEYPFEELVDKTSVGRDTSRNPVFDVMFNLLNIQEYNGNIPDSEKGEQNLYNHRKGTAKFDMNLAAMEIGERIFFTLEYSSRLFKPDTIDRIIGYFRNIVKVLPYGTMLKISEIEIMGEEEKEELLAISRGVPGDIDVKDTLHRLFERQKEKTPDHIAVVNWAHQHVSYRELNKRADALACQLREKGVKLGSIIGLMVERSIEMIVGILGIMKSGGAYLPIDSEYPGERKRYMLEDGRVRWLLVNHPIEGIGKEMISQLEIIDLRQEDIYKIRNSSLDYISSGTDLMYVIYTSGSTGKPKGVMVEHQNLANLLKYQMHFTTLDCSRILQFSTISFDASIHEIFSAFLSGGCLFLVSKELRADILELFGLIEKNGIKTVFLPISFLKIIFKEEEYRNRIPGCIKHIQTAGEQVIISNNFRRYLREKGVFLHNHYGPSETHVVTILTIDPRGDIPELPPIGKPVMNTGIYILDKVKYLVPRGIVGEIWIGGIQVGRGYWRKDELTNEKFIPNPFRNGEKLYRSGDLGRWLPDDNIEFLGRIDHQVKIRGFRIEMGEIENQLLNHPDVKECLVVARGEISEGKYLCAYIVSGKELSVSELREYLMKELPDYMIPSYFVLLEKIPLTPNGKIDRESLPEPKLKADDEYVAPRTEMEEKLVELWADVLGLAKSAIGINSNFFNLGGHSLKATILVSKIHKNLNIKIPMVELFKIPTIRGLSIYIDGIHNHEYNAIEPVEKRQYYDLSRAQKRLWILEQIEKKLAIFNLPDSYTFEVLNRVAFEKAIGTIIKRHEILRTAFIVVNGEPKQKIHAYDFLNFGFSYLDLRGEPNKKDMLKTLMEKETQIHFNLEKAPLLRAKLLQVEENLFIFIFTLHHIISDAWSMEVMKREFITLYNAYSKREGNPLQPLSIQYKDYSIWHNGQLSGENLERYRTYWLNQFKGEIPRLKLPADYPRPKIRSFEGKIIYFSLDRQITGNLKRICSDNGTTLFITFLSIMNVFFYRYTGQTDIIVGTPVAGREQKELENQIGFYVNMLGLRNILTKGQSFLEVLKTVKMNTLRAFEHQAYPFDLLVQELNLERDMSRNPLYDVAVTAVVEDDLPVNNKNSTRGDGNGGDNLMEDIISTSKHDLRFRFIDRDSHINVHILYNPTLFKSERIMVIKERLINLIIDITAKVDKDTADLDFKAEFEKKKTEKKFQGEF